MFQQERMDEIMQILKKYHYVTVDYLVEEIRYSPASIRRDLTLLEKQGLVTRSYGGVTLRDANHSPFRFRQHSMKIEKNAMAKRAAALVENGDVVYIDGSSTTQYIGHFLTEKKNITVITCNMNLANYLSENGIDTYCTGGRVVEFPGILSGQIKIDTISKFKINIAFFATASVSLDGRLLSRSINAAPAIRILRDCSDKLVYLCGSDKFDGDESFVSGTLDIVDCFISDGDFPQEMRQRYKDTEFVCVK